ncbi:winged helix-turn-helix transcriptional regulator [Cohnella sp. CFH 77786]|uniref:winged helix-turn-helix transcriptional regulator n=1 Tax=Cohnella sp. CFH 77786 TaxID=2662265 RepID=UPI001C60D31D|nr:winged helix-turn-helix transcriptional regulator [Cohnella sp. CFH 77786]MBW5445913.1 winged helix-turn-helix transcriptional regulator [Cohnella sp. CFH 77786]
MVQIANKGDPSTDNPPKHEYPAFQEAYRRWLKKHIRESTGERKRKLLQGLGYSEYAFVSETWWPLFGNFDHLYPEYAVFDSKDGTRFLDFAYMRPGLIICFEIDAFGTHHAKISRWKFDDNLDRQNDLVIDDWKVLRFSTDQVTTNPRHCQRTIQLAFGKWGIIKPPIVLADPIDNAIVRLMEGRKIALSPIEIARELGWSNATIARHLKSLQKNGIVFPKKSGMTRTTRYVLNRTPSATADSKQDFKGKEVP